MSKIEVSKDNQHLWNQFCRLGEMIGDGLHLEPDGKWISKEYKNLSRILIPEIKSKESSIRKKLKSVNIDVQMARLIDDRKCHCGGTFKQSRSGAKVVYCQTCNARYVAKVVNSTQ